MDAADASRLAPRAARGMASWLGPLLIVGSVQHAFVASRGTPLLYAHGEFGRLLPIPDTAGELGGEDVEFGS